VNSIKAKCEQARIEIEIHLEGGEIANKTCMEIGLF
jgi:hypothetical protein